MKAVVAYCRTAWEPQGGPPAVHTQARAIRRYAVRQGLAIREMYMDPRMRGISLERPELQRLIADSHAGKIGAVLVTDPERLSRHTGKLIALLDIFRKTGVHVEFTTFPRTDELCIPHSSFVRGS